MSCSSFSSPCIAFLACTMYIVVPYYIYYLLDIRILCMARGGVLFWLASVCHIHMKIYSSWFLSASAAFCISNVNNERGGGGAWRAMRRRLGEWRGSASRRSAWRSPLAVEKEEKAACAALRRAMPPLPTHLLLYLFHGRPSGRRPAGLAGGRDGLASSLAAAAGALAVPSFLYLLHVLYLGARDDIGDDAPWRQGLSRPVREGLGMRPIASSVVWASALMPYFHFLRAAAIYITWPAASDDSAADPFPTARGGLEGRRKEGRALSLLVAQHISRIWAGVNSRAGRRRARPPRPLGAPAS